MYLGAARKMPKQCKSCKYRAPQFSQYVYSCDYAAITGETRTGMLIKQYGRNFAKTLLEPQNCPFREKGMKISTRQAEIVQGSERSMKRIEPEFRQLHADGLTDYEISNKLHRSYATVKAFRQRLGLKANQSKRYIGQQMHNEIARLYEQGANDCDISRELMISPGVVIRWRKKYDKPANAQRGWNKDGQYSGMGSSADVYDMGLDSSADSDSERGGAETRSERGSMESVGEELL